MAFPASPVDGQVYNGFKYNATLGAWDKTNFNHSNLITATQGEGRAVEFLNGTKLQFGKSATSTTWPLVQSLHEEITPFPSIITDGPRSGYYTTAGSSNEAPTTTTFEIQWRSAGAGTNMTASGNAHWMAIGGDE